MHPQLSEHKTPQCADLIQALHTCHREKTISKFFGTCNGVKNRLTLCLRADRKDRTKRNLEIARQKRADLEKRWKEFDEGE
ncbi:hypothetical protein IWQ61_006552 [Dispira simplex]|nr:hypothetical protein IWQ61_006552 [Dispira simplex]